MKSFEKPVKQNGESKEAYKERIGKWKEKEAKRNSLAKKTKEKMKSYVVPIYSDKGAANAVFSAVASEYSDLGYWLHELEKQIMFNTATWGLKYRENMYGIQPDLKELVSGNEEEWKEEYLNKVFEIKDTERKENPYEERRNKLAAKIMLTKGVFNEYNLRTAVNTITGRADNKEEGIQIIQDRKNPYICMVRIPYLKNEDEAVRKKDRDNLTEEMKYVKPAHITLEYLDRNSHRYLSVFKHDRLSDFTNEQLSEVMINSGG